MRFGLFMQPVHHVSEHPTLALERDLELLSHLDVLGYEEAWIGEHHSTGWENIASPEIVIAAAAQRTKHIKLGTGVVQAGLHHPLVLADRMVLLDHLTRGRAMFGLGVGGGLPSDLKVFGLTPQEAGKRLDESLDLILRLFTTDEPISEETDWYRLERALLQMKPYTKPHMRMAVASTNPKNLEIMGRVGGQVLTGPIPHKVPELLSHLESGAAQTGRTASSDQIMLSYRLHLAETRDQAIAEFREGAITEHYDFDIGVNGQTPTTDDPEEWYRGFVEREIIGNPQDAIDKIEKLIEISGGFGGILFRSRDWAGIEASNHSFELFARHVAPRFQGHLDQQSRAASQAGRLNTTQ